MNTKLKDKSFLLIVPYTVPQYSGSGLNAFRFAHFLTEVEIKVTLLSFNRNLKCRRKELVGKVLIRRVMYFNKNILLKILSLFFIVPQYGLYIAKNDIILIYGGHIIGYEIIVLLGKLLGKKIIFQSLLLSTDDIKTIIDNKPVLIRGFYKKLFGRLDIYHSINPNFSESFRKTLMKKNSILEFPQGVDTSVFKPVTDNMRFKIREQLGVPKDIFVLITVGFVIPRKGLSGLFSALKDLEIPFKLIVIGEYDFPHNHFLSGFVNSAKEIVENGKKLLGEKLELTGPINEIQKYYQIADVVLFNSILEGLPNSLLEAMSCGIPVITRNIPGLEGYILKNQENCLIFKDENEMKDHICYLFENRISGRSIGSSAFKYIQRYADFQVVLSNYHKRLFEAEIESRQEN